LAVTATGERVVFELRKWPDALLRRTELVVLGRDAYGLWCGAPAGHRVTAPAGTAVVDLPVVFLFPQEQWWVARHFPDGGWKVDVTTPVLHRNDGITARDLDLDVRRLHGRTWIEDQDEFDAAGHPADIASAATETCAALQERLERHAPPFDVTGDRWLAELGRATAPPGRRAVFFDMGGVLLRRGSTAFVDPWCGRLGLDRDQLVGHVEEAIGGGWEAGRRPDQILASLAQRLGFEIEQADRLLADLHACEELDPQLLAFAAELPSTIAVGIISNNGADVRRHWNDLHRLDEQFAPIVISGEERVAKPAPRLYEIAAARAGVDLEHCVLVDDAERNVIGARSVGMHAIHHEDSSTTIAALGALLR
jgi:HAD superfamily hydrolase (TIGR01509 family)